MTPTAEGGLLRNIDVSSHEQAESSPSVKDDTEEKVKQQICFIRNNQINRAVL